MKSLEQTMFDFYNFEIECFQEHKFAALTKTFL